LQPSRFALSHAVINEWSKYEEQSQRVLDAYGHIFKIRTRVALVLIFILTYRYSFLHFATALKPDAINTVYIGLFIVPGIVIVWRVMTIRRFWPFLEFRGVSGWLHSVLFLLTPPLVASIAARCIFIIGPQYYAWLTAGPKRGLTVVPEILGDIAVVILETAVFALPLCCFLVRFAHPMLESIATVAITCTLGIAQFLYARGGPIPAHVERVISLGSVASISTICVAEFLTLYWLGLRLDYIPAPNVHRHGRWEPVNPRLQHFHRKKSGYSVVTITLVATVIMVWITVRALKGQTWVG
jgi:hypothetical protein